MSSIVELKKEIMNNTLKPFYIFSGEEIGLMNIYLNQLQGKVVRENSVSNIWTKLVQKSLIPSETIYVIRDDKDFISNETRWKRLPEIRYNTLILLVTKADKRNKLLNTFAEHTIQFDRMTPAQLLKHFGNKYKLPPKTLKSVIELCENDYSRIENELDKLARVEEFGCAITPQVVDELVFRKESFDVFGTVDKVVKYQVADAVEAVDTMFAKGESPLGFLTMLYNNFVAAAKVLGTSDAKEATVHIKQFMINKVRYDFNYSIDGAFSGMDILGDTIEGIKQGRYTEKYGTYLALFKIFNLE